MHRLFVAIRPPDRIRDRLLGAMGGIAGARWQTDDQLHLTLRFIGEIDRHLAGDVAAALGGIHSRRFEIAVAGLGTFDRRGRPEIVWAGIVPPDPVRALHNKVDQALTRVGVAPDRRVFHPHITLARLNRSSGPVGGFVEQPGIATEPFQVDRFGLFESRLTPEGAVYTEIERYPLD